MRALSSLGLLGSARHPAVAFSEVPIVGHQVGLTRARSLCPVTIDKISKETQVNV